MAIFSLALSCRTREPAIRFPNMIADMDPLSAGTVEVVFQRTFTMRMETREVELIFHPRLNTVSLEFRHELVNYRQFWDEAARRQFIAALELYKTDFADRKLIDRFNRTRSAYGKARGRLEWFTHRFSRTSTSLPTIDLGYRFRANAPFFTVLMNSAEEIEPESSSLRHQSQQVTMYFTRSQAEELARHFSQSYLVELIGLGTTSAIQPLVTDEYFEQPDVEQPDAEQPFEMDSY